jgi:hypothetical protein
MVSEYVDIKNDIAKTWIFAGIIIVLQFIGALSLTAGKGFSDDLFLKRFLVYAAFAIFGLGAIIFAQYYSLQKKKHILYVPLHEPEEALGVGKLKFFKNPVLLALLAILIFLPIFFVSAKFANTFFSGIPFHSQEVTSLGTLWGDAGFPATSENLLMYIPIIILLSLNIWIFRKLIKIPVLYWFNNIVSIPLVMAWIWKWFHNLVYGSNDFASYYTFAFGYMGVLLTLVTMSFVLWFIIHFLSNFMSSAKYLGILPNDSFLLWMIGAWILTLIIFITVNYFTKPSGSTVVR